MSVATTAPAGDVTDADERAAILVVDDNAGKRLSIIAAVEPLGHEIVEAESGEAALRAVMRQTFAVILMDVQMPMMDGYETSRLIRLRSESEQTPIIFITAHAREEAEILLAYASGAVDFIFAPVVPTILRAKVTIFVELFLKTRALQRSVVEVADSEARTRSVLDNVADGIVTVNSEGLIESFNRAAAQMFGYSEQEAIGQPFSIMVGAKFEQTLGHTTGEVLERPFTDFVHPDDLDATLATYADQAAGGAVIGFENRFRCRDGQYRWLLWSVTAVEDGLVYATARDVTERKRMEDAVREAEELLSLSFEHSPLGMILNAPDRGVLRINRAFADMLGYSIEELLANRKSQTVTDPDDLALDEANLRPLLNGTADLARWEKRYLHADGHTVLASVSVSCVRYADGSPRYLISQIEDISARKRVEADLAVASEKTIEASRQKSEFVANMSHEIRTPLSGVMGMVEVLRETALDPVQKEYVDFLATSGDGLLTVVNDILDFSKLEAGRLDLDPTDFDLRRAVDEARLVFAEKARAKGIELNVQVDADVLVAVNGDRARLRQILLNLLSNAVKFTTVGEVALHVSSAGPAHVRFVVSDTGIGIEQTHAARLFDPFTQADQSTTRNYGGTGLGLAISRQLVERMGGEIGAEPRVGGGSVFWFTATLPEATGAPDAAHEGGECSGWRVLIAQTRSPERKILEQRLANWKLTWKSVEEPGEALDALQKASRDELPFDLALVDFELPQEKGLQLVHAVCEHAAFRALGIVMLNSTQIEPESRAKAKVSAFLPKSVAPSDLYTAIARAVAGAPSAPPDPRAGASSRTLLDGPLLLVAEDQEALRVAARGRLAGRGIRTAFAENGIQAVQMAGANEYAAILMDCQMPELDGYEATRRIRAAENGRHTPIIAMTAHAMVGDRERCIAAGMNDYLSKPVLNDDLDAILWRWVPGYEPSDRAHRGNHRGDAEPGPEARQTNDVLDHVTVQELYESVTPEMRTRLIQTFEDSLSAHIADIERAVRECEPVELRRLAHMLKGLGATFGTHRLRLLAQRLEHAGRDGDPAIGEEQLTELHALAAEARQALRQRML